MSYVIWLNYEFRMMKLTNERIKMETTTTHISTRFATRKLYHTKSFFYNWFIIKIVLFVLKFKTLSSSVFLLSIGSAAYGDENWMRNSRVGNFVPFSEKLPSELQRGNVCGFSNGKWIKYEIAAWIVCFPNDMKQWNIFLEWTTEAGLRGL